MLHNGIAKIADFGFAKFADIIEAQPCNVGTPLYMSPEAIKQNKYSFKSDSWAVTCLFYELVFGKVPFLAQNEKDLILKV